MTVNTIYNHTNKAAFLTKKNTFNIPLTVNILRVKGLSPQIEIPGAVSKYTFDSIVIEFNQPFLFNCGMHDSDSNRKKGVLPIPKKSQFCSYLASSNKNALFVTTYHRTLKTFDTAYE